MKVLSTKRRLVLVRGMLSAATGTGCHRHDRQVHREFVPNVPHAALTIDAHTRVAWVGTLCGPDLASGYFARLSCPGHSSVTSPT